MDMTENPSQFKSMAELGKLLSPINRFRMFVVLLLLHFTAVIYAPYFAY